MIDLAKVSRTMRDILIAHLDSTPVPIYRIPVDRYGHHRQTSVKALLQRQWIRHQEQGNFPRHTIITEAGREALAAVLADYADALARATTAHADAA